MHWIIAEGIHSTLFQFVWCIPLCTEPLGRKKQSRSGHENFLPTRYAVFLSFTRKLITVVQKKERKKKKKFFENLGVKNVCLVEKRSKRAEKKCPFKIIILKTKQHKQVGRVGRVGWSARTHPCFVP